MSGQNETDVARVEAAQRRSIHQTGVMADDADGLVEPPELIIVRPRA